ncbi:MAG: RdgB/HAM1 family non-canonical purine NTP pyrophosphatase [Acidobacteriota bacterium]|nr:MAG: RdgB/HAM1 family non-canonical purine NTP pyrophosphatase [Acidobacteriota bacterium]
MKPLRRIVIGTRNEGKISELRGLLERSRVELLGLSSFEGIPEIPEDGATFGENAARKASAYAKLTGNWALADDSGLVVPALGGRPGVFSARFAGIGASDTENTAKLLEEMRDLEDDSRSACFVCEMAVAEPSGEVVFRSEGRCHGTIARKPIGIRGFGYDPVFVPEGFSETFGELSEEVKSRISHRSAAASKIADFFGGTTSHPT